MIKRAFFVLLLISLFSCSYVDLIKRRLPPPHPVEGGIMFQLEAPSARIVTLAGNFPDNQWGGTASSSKTYDPKIDPMYDDGTHGDRVADDGIWTIIKKIEPGRYQYKFVIDQNTWKIDPNNPDTATEGGFTNSLLIVK